jgi:hypothetical protein
MLDVNQVDNEDNPRCWKTDPGCRVPPRQSRVQANSLSMPFIRSLSLFKRCADAFIENSALYPVRGCKNAYALHVVSAFSLGPTSHTTRSELSRRVGYLAILISQPSSSEDKEELSESPYTIPNALTLARIIACPFLGYQIVQGDYVLATSLLFACGVSDWVSLSACLPDGPDDSLTDISRDGGEAKAFWAVY